MPNLPRDGSQTSPLVLNGWIGDPPSQFVWSLRTGATPPCIFTSLRNRLPSALVSNCKLQIEEKVGSINWCINKVSNSPLQVKWCIKEHLHSWSHKQTSALGFFSFFSRKTTCYYVPSPNSIYIQNAYCPLIMEQRPSLNQLHSDSTYLMSRESTIIGGQGNI